MKDSLFILTVVLAFTFLVIVIIRADRKPKYEIRYIQGWYVIQHRSTQKYIKKFVTLEDAQDWFNENCL